MTQTVVFGAPQAFAFIATIIGIVVGSALLFSHTNQPKSKRLLVGFTAWFLYMYVVWGAAGLWSGHSFWIAGFDPLLLCLRAFPFLLKAL